MVDLKKIAKLPAVEVFQKHKGTLYATIRLNDRIYVAPSGSLKKVDLNEDFLMAQVLEIRGPPYWLRIRFYNGAWNNSGNPPNLAPTELILGEGEEWISDHRVIDNMRDHFQEFEDSLPDPPRMGGDTWFHRKSKQPCVVCRLPYAPHQDRQRYCHTCEVWYHLQCLGDAIDEDANTDNTIDFHVPGNPGGLDIENLGEDGFPVIFDEVLKRPTVRGHVEYDEENSWLYTGSGVQKGLVELWRQKGELPEDWLELLGDRFLEDFVIEKTWKAYHCPACSVVI